MPVTRNGRVLELTKIRLNGKAIVDSRCVLCADSVGDPAFNVGAEPRLWMCGPGRGLGLAHGLLAGLDEIASSGESANRSRASREPAR
jgi:hypothetical protein